MDTPKGGPDGPSHRSLFDRLVVCALFAPVWIGAALAILAVIFQLSGTR